MTPTHEAEILAFEAWRERTTGEPDAPEADHWDDGTRFHEQADDRVYVCGCGAPFIEHDELVTHIRQETA